MIFHLTATGEIEVLGGIPFILNSHHGRSKLSWDLGRTPNIRTGIHMTVEMACQGWKNKRSLETSRSVIMRCRAKVKQKI